MKVQLHCCNSSQKWCGEYGTYPSPCSPVFAQRWVGWLVEILLLVEGSGHWITVTGVKPPSVWLFQRKIYRSPAFGSNFKNVLKPAIYPRGSRSANGDSVGNNCFDGAPGSAFLLQPFIGSRRLKIGATQIGSQPYYTDFSLTDNRTQLNRLARQPALYPFLLWAEGGGGTGFSASQR